MISILLEEAIVHHTELPIPAVLYGVIALAGFLLRGAYTARTHPVHTACIPVRLLQKGGSAPTPSGVPRALLAGS